MDGSWLAGLIPLGLGIVFFAAGSSMVHRTRTLRRTGGKAYGRVVGVETRSTGRGGVLYHPVVRWITLDGREVQATAAIGKSWTRFRPGRVVLVHYDPREPARTAIEGYSRGVEWMFAAVGAALVVGTLAAATLAAL